MNAKVPAPHRLLRQLGTGLYLSENGNWVGRAEEAFDFPDLRSALTTCEQMQHSGVEMLLIFDRTPSEATLRLSD